MSYNLPYGLGATLGGAILGGATLGGAILGGRKHKAAAKHKGKAILGGKEAVRKEMKTEARHASKTSLARALPEKELLKLVPKAKLESKVVSRQMKKVK
jgi:hypothetical protein